MQGGRLVKSFRHIVPVLAALTLAALLVGCSKKSTPTGVTPLDETPPAAPTQVMGMSDVQTRTALLQWTPSTSPNVKGYEVSTYSPSPDQENAWVVVAETDADVTQYRVTNVTETTIQYFRVRAVTPSGKHSQWSAVALICLGPTPGGPSDDGDDPQLPRPRTP
jgi:hypothetical protein